MALPLPPAQGTTIRPDFTTVTEMEQAEDKQPAPASAVEDPAAGSVDGQQAEVPGGVAFWRASAAIVAATMVLDHATKFWAKAVLEPMISAVGPPAIPVIPGLFELRYAENRGAAFSLFYGNVGALAIVSLVALVFLGWWWRSLPASDRWSRGAIALVAGGAVGNLLDRIFRGYVVDMFHAYYDKWSWPIFNIADSAICVGVAILIVRSFVTGERQAK